jgi:hypothetical protein
MSLSYELSSMVIDDLVLKYKNGKINTSPAFQRKNAWKKPDRLRLVESIIGNKPIPSVFLYMRENANGDTIYDVIDGKQRVESILKYIDPRNFKSIENIEGKFKQGSEFHEIISFKKLEDPSKAKFKQYKIAVIQVSGDYEDILDLFININSLGAPLNKNEIRNAKFIQGPWVKYINELFHNKTSNKKLILINEMFKRNKDVDRMAKEEFVLELLISSFTEDIHDGKSILDKVLADTNSKLTAKKKNEFLHTFEWINSIFSIKDIQGTRLTNKSDFYSVFLVLAQYYRNGIVTSDKTTNKTIREIVLSFLATVYEYIENPRKKQNKWVLDYIDTITTGTDQKQHRIERNRIIENLLKNIPYKTKDKNRLFSDLQKRILWNSFRVNPVCPGIKCGGKELTWEDITIDHINAWIKGGKTSLGNGQILCKKCNSSKKDR